MSTIKGVPFSGPPIPKMVIDFRLFGHSTYYINVKFFLSFLLLMLRIELTTLVTSSRCSFHLFYESLSNGSNMYLKFRIFLE